MCYQSKGHNQLQNLSPLFLSTASALRGNTGLTELGLYYCQIPAEGMSQVAEALCGISTLRDLNLSGNTVDSRGARHLGEYWVCLTYILQ